MIYDSCTLVTSVHSGYVCYWIRRSSAALLFSPKHWLRHPKKKLFTLSTNLYFLDQSIKTNILYDFGKRSTAAVPEACAFLRAAFQLQPSADYGRLTARPIRMTVIVGNSAMGAGE